MVNVEPHAVVAHRHLHLAILHAQAHPYILGLPVFGDVGDGFLHQPVDHQLGRGFELHRLQRVVDRDAGALRVFARQDFQGGHQTQVAECRRTQVFDDAALERDAAVECFDQMGQPFQSLRRAVGQARPDTRSVKFGRGEQGAQFVVQVARQAAAFVFARGLKVLRQLGQLLRALKHFDLQPVAFRLQDTLLLQLLVFERKGLPQVHEQRQQADRAQRRYAYAAQHQGVVDVGAAGCDLAGLIAQQFVTERADRIHVFLADTTQHHFPRGVPLALFVQTYREGDFREPGLGRLVQLVDDHSQLGLARVVAVQEFQGFGYARECRVVGQAVFLAAGQQVTALPGFGVHHALGQALDVSARRRHGTQRIELGHRLPIGDFADEYHRRSRDTGQRKYNSVTFNYGKNIHVLHQPENMGSCSLSMQYCEKP